MPSESCPTGNLPRVCRICGAPALPKECNNGLICRECYNKHRRNQQYHKRHEPTEREAKTCKYCGAPAMGGGRGAICRDCYNIRQNDRYPYIRTRKYEPCRICGTRHARWLVSASNVRARKCRGSATRQRKKRHCWNRRKNTMPSTRSTPRKSRRGGEPHITDERFSR